MSNKLIICDIDGVVADCSHRLKFMRMKDYDTFYGSIMADDVIIKPMHYILDFWSRYASTYEDKLIFLTGRPERTRGVTELWLKANMRCRYDALLMRKDEDYRPSPEVKVELLQDVLRPVEKTKRKLKLKRPKRTMHRFDTVYFIDDNPKNVKAVCKAYPEVVGITFGIKRLEEA